MLTLVIGGSGSGKSEYAESLAMDYKGKRVYLAAMQPFGAEAVRRIERHRALRANKGFVTVEKYTDADRAEIENSLVLLECITNLAANEMFSGDKINSADFVANKLVNNIKTLYNRNNEMIIVTGNIDSDGGEYSSEICEYITLVGEVNSSLAAIADRVIEVVCGIPLVIK